MYVVPLFKIQGFRNFLRTLCDESRYWTILLTFKYLVQSLILHSIHISHADLCSRIFQAGSYRFGAGESAPVACWPNNAQRQGKPVCGT